MLRLGVIMVNKNVVFFKIMRSCFGELCAPSSSPFERDKPVELKESWQEFYQASRA